MGGIGIGMCLWCCWKDLDEQGLSQITINMFFLISPIFSFRELPTPCIRNFLIMNTASKSCTLDKHFGGIQTMRMWCTHPRAMLLVYAMNC
jgi:hypothetical protein